MSPRINRVANAVVAAAVALGLLATWPKDADDLVFGAFQMIGLVAVVLISIRGRFSEPDLSTTVLVDDGLSPAIGAGPFSDRATQWSGS